MSQSRDEFDELIAQEVTDSGGLGNFFDNGFRFEIEKRQNVADRVQAAATYFPDLSEPAVRKSISEIPLTLTCRVL